MVKFIVIMLVLIGLALSFWFIFNDSLNPSSIASPTPVTVEEIEVKIYFNNEKLDPEFTCTKTFPVIRNAIKTKEVALIALEELLKGPTSEDKSLSYSTSIPDNVKINYVKIENGTAYADFDYALDYEVGGSCRVTAIRSQITETLKQFPTIKEVVISVNGRSEDILQP